MVDLFYVENLKGISVVELFIFSVFKTRVHGRFI